MRPTTLDRPMRARDRRVAFTLLSALMVAVALLVLVNSQGTPTAGAPRGAREPSRARARGLDAAQATAVARHFLRGYLSIVYGHAPAHVLPNAAPGIAAGIAERRRVPPALRRLHPRVVSVTAVPDPETGDEEITARISDGEVVTYPIRLLLDSSRDGRLLVAKAGED